MRILAIIKNEDMFETVWIIIFNPGRTSVYIAVYIDVGGAVALLSLRVSDSVL